MGQVVCRVDPLPTTTTASTFTKKFGIPGENLPKLPCVQPMSRKKRRATENVATSLKLDIGTHRRPTRGTILCMIHIYFNDMINI